MDKEIELKWVFVTLVMPLKTLEVSEVMVLAMEE